MNTITFCMLVYGIGAIIAFFVVLVIKGIFAGLQLFKHKENKI